MTLYRSMGAALDTGGTGTNPLDVRKDWSGVLVREGVFPGGTVPLVTGTAGWAYSIGAGAWATSSASGDGLHVWGNDGAVTVGSTGVGTTVPAAPSAGLSRIDIIWVRHPSNGENADTSSAPVAGVAVGTAAASPVAPALPAGAFELARNTMTDAATTTASAGNTITQTAPFTAARGGVIPVRSTTERDVLTAVASAQNPITVSLVGDLQVCSNGSTWQQVMILRGSEALAPATNFRALTGHVAGAVRLVGDRVLVDAGRIQRSTGTQDFADTVRVPLTTAMSAAYRPTAEVTVMTAAHFGTGTPASVELHFMTSGVIEARVVAAPKTLGVTSADWIAIPPVEWPAP